MYNVINVFIPNSNKATLRRHNLTLCGHILSFLMSEASESPGSKSGYGLRDNPARDGPSALPGVRVSPVCIEFQHSVKKPIPPAAV